MGEAINIPADKIVFDKSIYPRFEVDPERIKFFVELLENEAELDPIRVVKHDGSYVLIEGKHRLDAHKICGIYEIPGIIEKIERKLWRLYAAKYNVRTSKPLSRDELKSVIKKVYEVDGIKKSSIIAENLSCTIQYVNKVLKSRKDDDKQWRIARARELSAEGLSQQQIANKLSEESGEIVLQQTVSNWLGQEPFTKNETVSFFVKPVTTTLDHPSESRFLEENQQQITDQKPVTFATRNKAAISPDSDHEALKSTTDAEAEDPIEVSEDVPESPPESIVPSESSPDEGVRPQPTFLAEAVSEFLDLEPVEEKTLVAAYMMLLEDDVESIARQVEEPPVWVRKTAAILAYTYWRYSVEDIMEKLEVTEDRAAIIGFVHQVMPKNIPTLEKLIEWINTNTKYHDDLMEMIRQEVIEQCFKAQDECELPQPVSEIPPDIDQGFIEAEKFLEDVLQMLEQRQFQGKLLEELMLRFNGLQPVLNEIRQTLRKLV